MLYILFVENAGLNRQNALSFVNITQTLPDTRRCILQKARPLHNKEVT